MAATILDYHTARPEASTPFVIEREGYELVCGLKGGELTQAHRLRAEVFCTELGWVGQPGQQIETDPYDSSVIHLGVRCQGRIAAYLRVHPYWAPWMVDRDFAAVLPSDMVVHRPGTCEVSRLAIAPEFRRGRFDDGLSAAEALYQLLFSACRVNNFQTVLMVVSGCVLRTLQRQGLPCLTGPEVEVTRDRDAPLFATLNWLRFLSSRRPAATRQRARYLEAERDARRKLDGEIQPAFHTGPLEHAEA